jgi:hypothetical protein
MFSNKHCLPDLPPFLVEFAGNAVALSFRFSDSVLEVLDVRHGWAVRG